jgi:hypothetical protein
VGRAERAMKAFRGTLVALVLLLVVGVVVWFVHPAMLFPEKQIDAEPRLFDFEKHEMTRAEVTRPDGETIVLAEHDGKWTIEGTNFVAGRSMVNRIKHQIHDLSARATVVENPEAPELYGLGANAIQVKLTLRDGRTIEFMAGDPNPSSVSYYVQRKGDEVVYTVKKAAVDYYSLTLEEFREQRFASFDSKDATRLELHIEGQDNVVLERRGDDEWQMLEPRPMRAEVDVVKRMLGRVAALKAKDYIPVAEGADLSPYGLAKPRAEVDIKFASRDPLHVLVGSDAPSDNKYEDLAYVMVQGDDTVYVAKRGLLEDFTQDPKELRNRRVVEMKSDDVVAIDAVLRAEPGEDLEGEAGVRYAAEQWVWKDGVPVPGSTPSRVAERVAELDVVEFVDDAPKKLEKYGLADPVARVVLTDVDGNERVVLIGSEGPSVKFPDPDGKEIERKRRYASIAPPTDATAVDVPAGSEKPGAVYLVDDGVLSVVQDMIREFNRKKKKDQEKMERREKIPTEKDEEEPREPPTGVGAG